MKRSKASNILIRLWVWTIYTALALLVVNLLLNILAYYMGWME